jgi:hypothetical protein
MASRSVECPAQHVPHNGNASASHGVALLLATVLLCGPGSAVAEPSSRLELFRTQHAQLRKDHLTALDKIRAFCAAERLSEGVRAVEAAIGQAATKPATNLQLPNEVAPGLSPDLPAPQRQWQSQLRTQRRKHAQALFVLSRRVLKAAYTSFAYDLVRESAASDPDSRPARLLLGFVRSGKRWVTPFAAAQLRRRHVWHSKFGWLPASHVEKYDSGQRFFKRRWVSLQREAELRRDFRNAWEVRTDHFLVRTNHSLEEGVALAESLETFYRFFHSTFAGFFKTPEQIQKLFDGSIRVTGSQSRTPPRPHVVHFYRDRDEYRRTLKQRIPQIDITNGLYMPEDRIAYFFHGEPVDPLFPRATLFHEATHQLLYESQSRQRPIAHNANFWIVEGFACYMESFQPSPSGYNIGDPNYVRFHWARHRVLKQQYYIPLKTFASMGMRAFQTDPNISRNYSQASGLAHFLLHHDGGRYRDALIRHLSEIYTPGRRISVSSLETLTRVGTGELDRQYRRYLALQQSRLSSTRDRTPRQ